MHTPPYPQQRPWSSEAAATLLSMSGELPGFETIGQQQLDAAVALHRMLLEQGAAYLADEVGMGKTYVALAVVALLRHLQPGFRVLYITPSQNVLDKWHARELPAFIRDNVRAPDMRVQGPGGLSPAASIRCHRADDWLQAAVTDPTALDVFLPLSALSFPLTGDANHWSARVKEFAASADLKVDLRGVREKATFKNKAASVINQAIPHYDLVIIDEAHLLKGGAGKSASDRARFLAQALGAMGHGGIRRFSGALLLSGTPFDRDLRQLANQFELFAPRDVPSPPHSVVKALAKQQLAGATWKDIQPGLKPFLVRRVQKLTLATGTLSRNQYRTELRSQAGISLAGDTTPDGLKQRLFTAVVQKRLIEHLEGQNEGRFPMAMFSSWEAYSPSKKKDRKTSLPRNHKGVDDEEWDEDSASPFSGEIMDASKEGLSPQDARAVDSSLMEDLVGSYQDVFGKIPPHPKLEKESNRLAKEAFGDGLKQLVFVRRLKSVDDLYRRINEAYDHWLSGYLTRQGMPGCPEAIWTAQKEAARIPSNPTQPIEPVSSTIPPSNDSEEELPARRDTLFNWFFSGQLDAAGQAFIDTHQLPPPGLLRSRLRDPERFESVIGELDWRGLAADRAPKLPEISSEELAQRASAIPGPGNILGRYRRLQCAWAQAQADLDKSRSWFFRLLSEHLIELLAHTSHQHDRISIAIASQLLDLPTVSLGLYRQKLGSQILPGWERIWNGLSARDRSDLNKRLLGDQLRDLDLHREVLFAMLRLDHPFIDVYLGWLKAPQDDGRRTAQFLVDRVLAVCCQDDTNLGFGSGSILRNLADAWAQIAKTNFASFLKGSDRIHRSKWRREIMQNIGISPVEWASGDNTEARSVIARRFRMPGYPMVLVSTSVLQEGEDLHTCCDRVTHFGISGSPIGIEQKNGRVDRIGSRAHRRLLSGKSVEEAGIYVRFPHLSESLEWYQIRDLSQSINDYLHSVHEIGKSETAQEDSLARTLAKPNPIPPLITEHLLSPFEPDTSVRPNCVRKDEVEKIQSTAQNIIDHASCQLAQVARIAGFQLTPGRLHCFHHPHSETLLSLQPAHITGELALVASRPLGGDELPDWLSDKALCDGAPELEELEKLTADPRHKHVLTATDNGLRLHVQTSCFARGEAELQRSEVEDLLTRLEPTTKTTDYPVNKKALVELLTRFEKLHKEAGFIWKRTPTKLTPRRQWIQYRKLRITLEPKDRWVIASCVVDNDPGTEPFTILRRTLWRNGGQTAADFHYAKGAIRVRLIHPIADLGVPELLCILRELSAAAGSTSL